MRKALVICLVLVLVGCSGLAGRRQTAAPLIKDPASSVEAVGIARDLSGRGRWSDALAVLEAATRRFPGDQALAAEHRAMQAKWELERRALEDLIMVGDAENQQQKIELLEKISLAEPDNLVLTSRRLYWKDLLDDQLEPLTACAERHAKTAPALARRCYQAASDIASTEDSKRRLAGVNEQLRLNENIAAERRVAREQRERQARAKVLLDNAKAAIEARDYRRALDVLDQVAELQPENREVAGLKHQALAMISPQVEALVKLGDHLYLDEQLEAAVATWKAALSLTPDNEEILARIERAENVLQRLDALRRQQRTAGELE